MPLDFLSLLEAIGSVTQLLPVDYEGRYSRVAATTVAELHSALGASTSRSPFEVTHEEQARFKAAKTNLVTLVSNPPAPAFPLHEGLKVILPATLEVSRGMSTGTLTKDEVLSLIRHLDLFAAEYGRA